VHLEVRRPAPVIDLGARIAFPAARIAVPRWAWAALLALLLLPRLWRFDAVGEGTDEGYSVAATRAMLDGRFSYVELNDFLPDGYQAKFSGDHGSDSRRLERNLPFGRRPIESPKQRNFFHSGRQSWRMRRRHCA
jgi:hypothetical protein